MHWEAIGAVAELVGAIAVVATIMYLAMQLRMSNKFEAAKHQDVHMDRIRERMLVLAQDEDLARITRMARRGEVLEELDQFRSRAFASHRIVTQRDAWARARVLGNMPGLPPPERYLDILIEEMKTDQSLLSEWRRVSPRMKVAWEEEFIAYIDAGLVDHDYQ